MLPEAIIEQYDLKPLPVEGTLFLSTYRSKQEFENGKPYGTAIIALHCNEPYSITLFHKLPADEIWHFYSGDLLRLILLYPDGSSKDVIMGNEPLKGQHVQFVIPAGVWQAGHMIDGGRYSLYGCTMSPGFATDMFEGGTRENLMSLYPERAADTGRLHPAFSGDAIPQNRGLGARCGALPHIEPPRIPLRWGAIAQMRLL